MRYLSVCAGIEAATVAWHHLGWEPAGFSEIEKFPSQVLEHHYPNIPKLGDMTKYKEWEIGTVDLLVGGTPCQSFSVAGLRKGLADPRGNLALVYCGILDHYRPKWFVWENVPGVLSSNGGRDFGSFLGALAQLGYGFAYRVLDAQYFGVAQRRRRVFVVGYLGDWRPAAAVLFEPKSLPRDSAPSREKREKVAESPAPSVAIQGNLIGREKGGPQGVGASDEGVMYTLTKADVHGVVQSYVPAISNCLETTCNDYSRADGFNMVAHPIPIDSMNHLGRKDSHSFGDFVEGAPSFTLTKGHHHAVAQPVAFQSVDHGADATYDLSPTLRRHDPMGVMQSMAVRRLTPVECERLQGFPDGYTDIKPKGKDTPDGPRYKALGNSMAVPVMRWIGERIALHSKL